MNTIEKIDKLSKEQHQLTDKVVDLWAGEVFLTWRWWFGVIVSILVWTFWIKFHKKNSTVRLLTAGFFVMFISVSLDSLGVQIGLWSYRYEVFPFIPAYLPWDLALMPVIIMSLIQLFPSLSINMKALLFGVVTSFVGEPLVVWIDIYKPIHWKNYYSFPIYILIYYIAHRITTLGNYAEINKEH